MTLRLSPPLRAQSPVYGYSEYWGVYGWNSAPYLPDTQLQISQTGDSVSVWWPRSISNAVLQTATSPTPEGAWTTMTNQAVESVENDSRTVTMPGQSEQQYFRLAGTGTSHLPVFAFTIFYNGQLEFTWCGPMTVRGRTHANGPVCLGPGPGVLLSFLGTVTTTSSILKSNLGGYLASGMTGTVTYSGDPPSAIGVPVLRLPIDTNHTANAYREIINLPPPGESASSLMGQQRFYNKASIALLVSNASVTMIIKDYGDLTGTTTNILYNSASPSATERTNLAQALPFLSLTNVFRDYRESDWVRPTQIDMAVLKDWLPTNSLVLSRYPAGSSSYPNILYVADFRTLTNLHAIRLANGAIIPTNGPSAAQATGFTIATPNPLYVWGHYNSPNPTHLGTTNTSDTFPASLVCDAITVLSPNWTDSVYGNGATALSSRNAANTTINAAIIAGSVYSTGSNLGQWSGGVHNLTRLLEAWGGDVLTLNTSLVNLYDSVHANTQFSNPGVYYSAPATRNFNFDQNFNNVAKLPPGTPVVVGIVPAD